MKKLLIVFLVLFIALYSSAITRYVATTGNDSNAGTITAPYKTIQHAADVVNPGDIVIVKDGVYTNTIPNYGSEQAVIKLTRSGTASSYITFQAEHKWGAVLDGQSFAAEFGIMINTASYIKIDGFEIKDIGIWAIPIYEGSNYIEIRNCKINSIGVVCTATTNGLSAIALFSANHILIEKNLIYNIGRLAPDEGCTIAKYYQWQDHGIYIDNSNFITIQKNIIYGVQGGWTIHFYSGSGGMSSNNYILNNTIAFGKRASGLVILYENVTNTYIQNNIFYHGTDISYDVYAGYNHGIVINTGYTYSNVQINYNLTYRGSGLTTSGVVVPGVTSRYNINNTNPLILSESNFDFSLQLGSLAIHAGVDVGLTSDYLGNPVIGKPDIGALEYQPTAITYYNTTATATAIRNNCPTNYTGSVVTYIVPANKYSSTTSQAEADLQATNDLTANKQAYANTNGICTAPIPDITKTIKISVQDGKIIIQDVP